VFRAILPWSVPDSHLQNMVWLGRGKGMGERSARLKVARKLGVIWGETFA